MTQHTPYLLKVLSGSNAGALVRLKVGDVVIGRSMSSDIILHDESIADLHAKLKVTEDRLTLEALAQPIAVDNQPMVGAEIELKPYQVVTLGKVDFFIADVRKPNTKKAETGEAGATVNANAAKAKSVPPSARDRIGQAMVKPSEKKLANKLWLLLGLGLLLLANLLFFKPYLTNFAETVGLKESAQQRAEQVLKQLPQDKLSLSSDEKGKATIIGYVDTREEKRDLMNKVMLAGGDINYRIWVREDLVANAERIARALGQTDLRFENLQDGYVAANGYISNEEAWARVKTNIMSDVSGIQGIDDKDVQTLLKRKEALVQFVEKKGLSSRVKVTIENNRIKVDGELTQSELANWDQMYQEFVQQYGEGPDIIASLYDARNRIKLAIRSVSVGKTPFLVAKDGKKYMEGSSLGDGYFIKQITPDQILLSNNGIEIPIHYGAENK